METPYGDTNDAIDISNIFNMGLLLIAYAIPPGFPSTGWNWVGWIWVVPIVTGFVGTCSEYSVLGVSTCTIGARKS